MYIYTTEFYPSVKKNEIAKQAGKFKKLENIRLSEVTQAPKDTRDMLALSHMQSQLRFACVTWGACKSQDTRNGQLPRGFGKTLK